MTAHHDMRNRLALLAALSFFVAVLPAHLLCRPAGGVTLVVDAGAPRNVSGKDDVQRLKLLASGVGWEFEPNAETAEALKEMGFKSIRCINVDPLPGKFDESGDFIVGDPARLLPHLRTCRAIGADPHVVIATGLHPDLQVKTEGSQPGDGPFGPNDWDKFRSYCRAYFRYVLVDQGFPNARFEVGNEPDIAGRFPRPAGTKPVKGSEQLYTAYLKLYKNVAQAAEEFEKSRPGVKVRLGGPAAGWAFTYRYGRFKFVERFLRDCGQGRVKLDFIGVHYYGNMSSLSGQYRANYPSFSGMLKSTVSARNRYCPGVPVWITEWGASYNVSNKPESVINANHVGAAWGAAFLDQLVRSPVEGALYLVTTDLRSPTEKGAYENVWGWPSLFVNPKIFGKPYPKAPCHIFDMISRLQGKRVKVAGTAGGVSCFASVDGGKRALTALVWNYDCRIRETQPPVDGARTQSVTMTVRGAKNLFRAKRVKVERWEVSETVSNAYHLFRTGGTVDDRAHLQKASEGWASPKNGKIQIAFNAPPSSVSFVRMSVE